MTLAYFHMLHPPGRCFIFFDSWHGCFYGGQSNGPLKMSTPALWNLWIYYVTWEKELKLQTWLRHKSWVWEMTLDYLSGLHVITWVLKRGEPRLIVVRKRRDRRSKIQKDAIMLTLKMLVWSTFLRSSCSSIFSLCDWSLSLSHSEFSPWPPSHFSQSLSL